MPEPWPRIYREAPGIFDAFGRAEDPDGLIVRRVRELAGLEGKRILEIGAGTGRYSREWANHAAQVVALEPNPKLLAVGRKARPELSWVVGQGERLPFRDYSLDGVLATWVLAYLRPEACGRVLQEARRVLRGGAIWLVENHWTGAFQELRGRAGLGGEPGVERLLKDHGFRVAEVVETELRFPSAAEAQRLLGTLCGPAVAERLALRPTATIGHHVVLLVG